MEISTSVDTGTVVDLYAIWQMKREILLLVETEIIYVLI